MSDESDEEKRKCEEKADDFSRLYKGTQELPLFKAMADIVRRYDDSRR